MNLLLLSETDFPDDHVLGDRLSSEEHRLATIADGRVTHLKRVLKVEVGQTLTVGLIGGSIGRGVVLAVGANAVRLAVYLDQAPPPTLPVSLVLALPRPPMLRRSLEAVTTLGVKRICLIHANRVEKSYWQSHSLEPEAIDRRLRAGLEQACDTVLPEVSMHRRFRPFVEDELPALLSASTGLVADPTFDSAPPPRDLAPFTLIVGPEGGFVPFELERLAAAGVEGIGLGPRILRVETAVIALLSRWLV